MGNERIEQKAIRKLKKEFKKMPELIQRKAVFFPHKQDEKTYTWTFKIDCVSHEWIYVHKAGIIVKCIE